jgi:hypothetical protein
MRGCAAKVRLKRAQPFQGWKPWGTHSQGSSFLATLGFEPESLRDSQTAHYIETPNPNGIDPGRPGSGNGHGSGFKWTCCCWRFLLIALIFLGLAAAPAGEVQITAPSSVERLSSTNLLVFHDAQGQVKPVRSVSDWLRRRSEIRRGMESIMGPLPSGQKRCALDVRVEQETDQGNWLSRKITYQAEPGSRVPAYLLIPKTALEKNRSVPAILVLHPTDMEFGNRVVVEQLRPTYRAYGRDLVERGFVVLAPPYPIMAGYEPNLEELGYKSGTMKAVWDNMRGVDLLESLPCVSTNGIGAIGHSLGGHNAIFTAVFDDRIKAIVSSCGFDSFQVYKGGDIRGWTSSRYMPALLAYKTHLADVPFDFSELLGALAPRKLFINAPLHDDNFNYRSVDEIVRAAAQVYALYGSAGNIELEHPDCAHDFPESTRLQAYDFLELALKKK